MFLKNLLILCHGNICRSPMAEGFFCSQLKKYNSSILVSSAGINAVINHPAEPHAQEVMNQNDIDISSHRARQVSIDLILKADLILLMSKNQLRTLSKRYPLSKGKTFLLGYWHNEMEIEDPFRQPYDVFEKTFQKIKLAWKGWDTRIFSCQRSYV